MSPLRRLLLVAIVAGMGLAGPPSSAPAAGQRSVTVERPPSTVRPGDRVEVRARATGLRGCALRLIGPSTERSRVSFDGSVDIVWAWRVPLDAAARTWRGRVQCSAREGVDPAAAPDASTSAWSLRVRGSAGGAARISDGQGIAVAVAGDRSAFAETSPKWTEIGQLVVSFVGSILALLGLYLVYRQLKTASEALESTRDQTRTAVDNALSDRTAQLIERYQRPDFLEECTRVGPWYLKAREPADMFARMRIWEEAPHGLVMLHTQPDRPAPTLTQVQAVLNFHEELGVLFNMERVDRTQIVRQMGTALVLAFDMAWWWIQWQRGNRPRSVKAGSPEPGETEQYAEFERMALKIREMQEHLVKLDADPVVAILVLPNASAPRWDWERHRQVSLRLSRRLDRLDALEKELEKALAPESQGVDPKTEPNSRVICVGAWHRPDEHARLRRLAWALAAIYDRDGVDGVGRVAAV